jgi:hypothetical protein
LAKLKKGEKLVKLTLKKIKSISLSKMTKFRHKKTLHLTTIRIFDLANSRPLCHLFKKGGALVSQLVPRPNATCFKKVELFYRTFFFQAPVSPVSKTWSARLAPSSSPQCHLFQKGVALVSHLLPGPTVTRFKKVERSSHTFFANDSRAPLQAPFVCLPPSRWFLVLGRRPRTSPRI